MSDFWSDPSSISVLNVCEQRRLWRDCADAQARLSLRWSPMWYARKAYKLMGWLICFVWWYNNLLCFYPQPSNRARCLIFGRTLRLFQYLMCANSEGSGETARMRRLVWAFAGRLCDKYRNLTSWLKSFYPLFWEYLHFKSLPSFLSMNNLVRNCQSNHFLNFAIFYIGHEGFTSYFGSLEQTCDSLDSRPTSFAHVAVFAMCVKMHFA